MKMPKIIDTGQPHPLRTTNPSNLSSASNNNLKESNHQHRSVNVGSGGTILATTNTISTNNNSTNNNSNTIYTMPMSNIPDTEGEKWLGDPYGQQQEKLAITSKANQISSSQHLNHVIQANNSVMNISNTPVAGTVNTATVSCILEEHIEKLPCGAVVPRIELSDNRNESSSGGTSQDTINNDIQTKSEVAGYIKNKDTKSPDASPTNNRISTMLSSSSCSKTIVSNQSNI